MNNSERNLILLVDDNEAHQYSLRRNLEIAGFSVIQARTGTEALALAKTHLPAVVLLDIHLPDVTGFDVCRELKSDERTASIPVVFHSATYDTQSAKMVAADLGAVSFLSCPIEVEHLLSVLRGAVVRSSLSSDPG